MMMNPKLHDDRHIYSTFSFFFSSARFDAISRHITPESLSIVKVRLSYGATRQLFP